MTGTSVDATALLEAIALEPEDRKAELIRAAGPVETVFQSLGAALERLAMTRVAEATSLSEEIVALAGRLAGPAAQAAALRARAQCLAYGQRYDEALPVVLQAVAVAEDAGLTLEAARARLAAVHPLVNLARYDEAIASTDAARAVFLAHDEALLAGRAAGSIGGVLQKMGRAAEALARFDEAAPLLAGDPVAAAQMHSNRGLALVSLDRFAEAEAAYLLALDSFEEHAMAWAVAIVIGNLAELCVRQGRLAQALHYYERARRHLDADTAPAALARILVEQADVLTLLGQHAAAIEQYRTALPSLERHGLVREALQARAGVGAALLRLGEHAAAESVLRAVVDEHRALGQSADAARFTLLLAENARAAGRAGEAERLAREALDALADRPASAAAARFELARLALADGRLEAARDELDRALPIAEALDLAPLRADLLHARGSVFRASARLDDAIRDLRGAVEQVERVRGMLQAERFRASFHRDRLTLYADLVRAALERSDDAHLAIAFDAIERAKSRALLDQVQGAVDVAQLDAGNGDARDRALAAELAQLRSELSVLYSRLADAALGGDLRPEHERWRERARTYEHRIEELEARLTATRGICNLYARPVTLDEVRASLDACAALVEYFDVGGEMVALVVRAGSVLAARGLAPAAAIGELVERVHFQIRRALRTPDHVGPRAARMLDDARRALGALHDAVFRPLRDALIGVERLLVVPHGPLHVAPFQALWDGATHVAQAYTLAYAPSASIWRRLACAGAATAQASGVPLVVGVADELAPDIEAEARTVADVLNCPSPLLGAEATVARVASEVGTARLVHLACHGLFSATNPIGSGLRLGDRWMTVREIYGLRLSGSIVTLSGCETGRSAISDGDNLLGLARGFLAAGASALIVSQWNVSDRHTREYMSKMYAELVKPGEQGRPAGAVRRAQLEALQDFPHPAHWAPFAVIGDP